MTKISVVINTLNEEENIARAIKSVADLAHEIVVVDMHSFDETVSIARKLGAKVFFHKKTGYVEPARNYAISKAQGDWVLVLDADEEVPATLKNKLNKLTEDQSGDYYRLPRKNIIFNKWIRHSGWWPDYNIRFFKKGKVVWSEIIHSVPETKGKGIDLPDKEEYAIIHHHYDSIEQYIIRMNRYTSQHSKSLLKSNYIFSWKDLITKPAGEFFSRYFNLNGYKDGVHGLALALLQAFSELVVYLKIWQKSKFKEENLQLLDVVEGLRKLELEQRYWRADALYKSSGSVIQRIKRKLFLP